MYTEVREQCMVERGLQGGYCGNDRFVADREGAFIAAWSLLRLVEFREGRNGAVYVVRFLATVVETTIAGGDLSALDMGTQTAVITFKDRLPTNTLDAYITLGRQQSAREDDLEWVPSHFPRRRTLWR